MRLTKQLFIYGGLPIVLFILFSLISFFLGGVIGFYITTFSFYGLLTYWTLLFFYKSIIGNKKDDKSLYGWLDKLNGDSRFIKELFTNEEDSNNLMKNLEIVYSNLNKIVEGDVRKLKLLRAYFKAKNIENSLDLFGKALITLILAVSAGLISSGKIFKILMPKDKTGFVDFEFYQMLGLIYIITLLIVVIISIILETNQHKKRNKFIEEIIEVSIEEH